MPKYKAVLLDLDDTLTKSNLIYNQALRYAAEFLSKKYSLSLEELYSLLKEKYKVVSQSFPTVHTRHSRILIFRQALDEMVGKYDLSLLPDVEDLYWDFFLDHIETYPGVESTLAELRKHGIKIAIVSDGSLSLRIRKIKASGLMQYVDQVIASEEVIFEKPFSAIFTLALSRLEVEHYDAIMLGNNYKNDISGAQQVGIRSGIFDPIKDGNVEGKNETIKPDFILHQFPELLKEVGLPM